MTSFSQNKFALRVCFAVLFVSVHTAAISNTVLSTSEAYAEEYIADGATYIDSTDLEFCLDLQYGEQIVAIMFTLNIPREAVIESAFVQFQTKEAATSTGLVNLLLFAEASVTPSLLRAGYYNVSGRVLSNNVVTWSPSNWPETAQASVAQKTSNIALLVQELVVQPTWNSGNKFVVIIKRSSNDSRLYTRNAYTTANLTVTYSTGSVTSSITPSPSVTASTSITSSITRTSTLTPSQTASISVSPSNTPSRSESSSATPSTSFSASTSFTPSVTSSLSESSACSIVLSETPVATSTPEPTSTLTAPCTNRDDLLTCESLGRLKDMCDQPVNSRCHLFYFILFLISIHSRLITLQNIFCLIYIVPTLASVH
jgi:hypothetical protein